MKIQLVNFRKKHIKIDFINNKKYRACKSFIINCIIFGGLYLLSYSKVHSIKIIDVIICIIGTTIETAGINEHRNLIRYYNDRFSKTFILLSELVFYGVSIRFISHQNIISAPTLAGIALIALGFVTRIYSINLLGFNYHPTVSVTSTNTLITKGLYKWIRHPCYLGVILLIAGLLIHTNLNLYVVLSSVPVIISLAYRIKIEEDFLIKHFKTEYIEYKKTTKLLIPYIF